MLLDWQQQWHDDDKGRVTFELLPRVSPTRHIFGMLATLASGHGKFPAYFSKFGYTVDDKCVCEEHGDSLHFLLSCPRTRKFREKLVYPRGVLMPIANCTYAVNLITFYLLSCLVLLLAFPSAMASTSQDNSKYIFSQEFKDATAELCSLPSCNISELDVKMLGKLIKKRQLFWYPDKNKGNPKKSL